MSSETVLHGHEVETSVHSHEEHGAHDHHHEESFLTKYIFSQDHKMIAKQFLITGIIWAIIITSLKKPELQFINVPGLEVCNLPSNSLYRCRKSPSTS